MLVILCSKKVTVTVLIAIFSAAVFKHMPLELYNTLQLLVGVVHRWKLPGEQKLPLSLWLLKCALQETEV